MIGIIGGSGLSSVEEIEVLNKKTINTPYGKPSAELIVGVVDKKKIIFLPRHGGMHTIAPHLINYRANIWALQEMGVDKIVAVTAVGGISAELGPGVIAIPHQVIDYTSGRENSFYDGVLNELKHIDFTEPYSELVRNQLFRAAKQCKVPVVERGVYAATQGPRLETASEITRLESDGATLVGMTGMPEAALARELNLKYATISVVANWAAGKGNSKKGIEVGSIDRVLTLAMKKVREILIKFLSEDLL